MTLSHFEKIRFFFVIFFCVFYAADPHEFSSQEKCIIFVAFYYKWKNVL